MSSDSFKEILIAGGVMYWAFVLLAVIVLSVCVFNESLFLAAVVTGAAVAIAVKVFGAGYPAWAPTTVWGWVLVVAVWLAIGTVWGVVKFRLEYRRDLHARVGTFEDFKVSYRRDRMVDRDKVITDDDWKKLWNKHVDDYSPRVSSYSGRFTLWIVYWPISMASYVLGDLLRDLLNSIWMAVVGLLERWAAAMRDSLKR